MAYRIVETLTAGSLVGVLYLAWLAVQRLFLSPLAHFPGPRLAALSNWYEFYYDVIQQGQFTAHITQLHEQYGMCIFDPFSGMIRQLSESPPCRPHCANHTDRAAH